MRLVYLTFVLLLLPCHVFTQTSANNPQEKLLTAADLKNKTLQELWLMRNEISARRGRPFSTAELNAYFHGKGYSPDPEYSESRLSKTDKRNIARLLARENELAKNNYLPVKGEERLNFDNIINRFQYGDFSEDEKEKLSRNGFLFTPSKYRQLFHIYEENDYAGVGSFITVDTIIHLYHMFFDFSLRVLEEHALLPRLQKVSDELLWAMKRAYMEAPSEEVREAAWRNLGVFAVASALTASDKSGELAVEEMDWLDGSLKEIIREEIDLCRTHTSVMPSKIMSFGEKEYGYPFDYTQFTPRGHYTRSKGLTRFFMGMMWYGQFAFHPGSDRELLQTVLITRALYERNRNGDSLSALWDELYRPTVLFSGLSDDIGPREMKAAMDKACGDCAIADFTRKDVLDSLRAELREIASGRSRIGSPFFKTGGQDKYEIRFMGQRFVPDSDILQRLTTTPNRPMPMGLDVMAVLGSQVAKDLMLTKYADTWEEWTEYPQKLDELIKEYKRTKPAEWEQNFYWHWLWNLKALLEIKETGRTPFFMRTSAYQYRSLYSTLASWAQLRHDTILYAKQSVAAECGGGSEEIQRWIPEPPKGYVEPNLEFYRRMKKLVSMTAEQTGRLNIPLPRVCRPGWDGGEICTQSEGDLPHLWKQFEELVSILEALSVKELLGEPLTLAEHEQIRTFGSLLDHLTLALIRAQTGLPTYVGWESVGGPDNEIATIADVHTVIGTNRVLEEGVGYASTVYAVVELEGRLKLLRGAALSYYEFVQPLENRFSDERWQEMLAKDETPPAPLWTGSFLAGQEHIMPKPAYVLDPEMRGSSKKGERGWRTLVYETGS